MLGFAAPPPSGVVPAELVSVAPGGASGDDDSSWVEMSANGRYIVFRSHATNLTQPSLAAGGNIWDIFVRDRQTGTTTQVDVPYSPLDASPNGDAILNPESRLPSISADGRYVLFESDAGNLVPNDLHDSGTTGRNDVFVRDLQSQTTILVDVNKYGYASNHGGQEQQMTPDGRYVAFRSGSDILATDQTVLIEVDNVYVRDLLMNQSDLVSVNSAGTGHANDGSLEPVISDDGRYVAFLSLATDLMTPPLPGRGLHIYLRDRLLKTTEFVDVNAAGTVSDRGSPFSFDMSGDGRYIVFVSDQADLVPNDDNYDPNVLNSGYDVFVRDMQTHTTTLVSVNRTGTGSAKPESSFIGFPRITPDGRFVVFQSPATDLTYDTITAPGYDNVFLRDLAAHTTTLASVSAAGGATGNSLSGGDFRIGISDDGRFVAFTSYASDLVSGDSNGAADAFVRDLRAAKTYLLSRNPSGAPGNGTSAGVWLTPDGKNLAFSSAASDLVAGDTNGKYDIFYLDLTAYHVVQLTGVVSRKTHGNAGTFDVDLPLVGTRGIECRSGGANSHYQMVFTFVNDVTSCGSASIGTLSNEPNPNQCTVNLTGVANAQYITVTLNNVLDSQTNTGNVSGTMGVLLGDVNANGTVSNADVASIQAQVGATVTQSNFRNDVNANGTLSNGDVAAAQAKVGSQLPQ